ncbi:MAG: M20/M25/M40 family metallo-hydrolase [Candidatus Heimdallarchaeota archaeon]
MDLAKIHAKIDEQFITHLEKIQNYLRIKSISATGEGMEETATATVKVLEELDATEVHLAETTGYPVVYGERIIDLSKKTLLLYSMYDVQPVEAEKWMVDPFAGAIVEEFEDLGQCLVSRGVINTKGPTMAFFNALKMIIEVEGDLPCNLIFAIEGEEELGSLHFPEFVSKYSEQLKRADGVYFPFFAENKIGKVEMWLGVRGIIYLKLRVQGGGWGGPKTRHIHSSSHSWVDSPVWKLVHCLADMKAPDGVIKIPGFYEDVMPPSTEDEELLTELAETVDFEIIKDSLDITRFRDDLEGKDLLRQYLFSTTLNIDGLDAGYTGPGTKTILPCEARAYVDIRLVPNQDPEKQIALVKEFLAKYHPLVEMESYDSYPWAKVSIREPLCQALLRTYQAFGKEVEIWPHLGGSAPFYLFSRNLGLPFIGGGLGHGDRAHSPNEYAVVAGDKIGGIKEFEKSVVTFLQEFSQTEY